MSVIGLIFGGIGLVLFVAWTIYVYRLDPMDEDE